MREMARGIDTKPYLEWLDGVESVAVSPNTPHGIVGHTLATIIDARGRDFGAAIPELHLRLDDRPGTRTVLLPDVTFYRNETILSLDPKDRLLPNVTPELIVEVRSPDDRPGFREEKIRRYRAWGCPVVFDVDPGSRTIVVHSDLGVRELRETDRFRDPAVAWLSFDVCDAFARLALFGF
jgi:Uma2 family endonuclease